MHRLFLLIITALFSFGCMGAVNGMFDLDIDMQFAEDAVHPADFPVTPPAGGEKLFSMGMTADSENINLPQGVDVDMSEFDRVRMDMISYGLADPDAGAAKAVEELTAAGYGSAPSKDGNVATYRKDATLFVIATSVDGDQPSLNFIRLVPRASADAATEAPADAPAEEAPAAE